MKIHFVLSVQKENEIRISLMPTSTIHKIYKRIAWRRIKQGCKDISEIDTQIMGIQSNDIRDDEEAASLFFQEHGLMNMLQSDVRAFIDIARTIMDKVAKLIEKLLGLSPGKGHWPLKTFDNDPSFMS